VFRLNDNDRYLSFTLAGPVLDNPVGAPEYAFEVALLDASTGGFNSAYSLLDNRLPTTLSWPIRFHDY
jgi:hypothetical protein